MYLNVSHVKQLIKAQGKQASKGFITSLDQMVEEVVLSACRTWNGHRRRLVPELIRRKK